MHSAVHHVATLTPLPSENAAHAVPFWIAYGIWIALEMARSFMRRSQSTSRHDDRGSYAVLVGSVYVAMALAFTFAFGVPSSAFQHGRETLYVIGIIAMFGGVMFRTYAIRVLGRSFTLNVATRSDQAVCEAGPYRYVRHPAYAGTLATVAGIGLALGNWGSLVAALAAVALGHAYRIAVEERVLCRDLGAPYVAYMQRTRRLIPFVF